MSRKQQPKNRSKVFVASPARNNNGLSSAALFKVDTSGRILSEDTLAPFLLNPNSMEDNKSGNWVENNIPGQSDPILQWVSGGSRNLSFTALVTKDTTNFPSLSTFDWTSANADTALTAVGAIASRLAGVNLPPLADIKHAIAKSTSTASGEELSVAAMLDYYRSLMYPSINENGDLESSPPLVVLALGKTLSNISDKSITEQITATNTDIWVTKNVTIRITKWLPNLAPMEAEVSFQFVQYTMTSKSAAKVTNTIDKTTTGVDVNIDLSSRTS